MRLPPIDSTLTMPSALLVVEDAGGVVAASARLILLVGQPEEPTLEVDFSGGHPERRPCNALKVHAQPTLVPSGARSIGQMTAAARRRALDLPAATAPAMGDVSATVI